MRNFINLDKSFISDIDKNFIDLDKIRIDVSTTGDDYHSGYYDIITTEEITIEDRKQMTNWGGLIVDGILNVDGQLIIEA